MVNTYKVFLLPGFAIGGRAVNTYKAFLIPGFACWGGEGEYLQSVPDSTRFFL